MGWAGREMRVWCDRLINGAGVHRCDTASKPHEPKLHILERNNAPGTLRNLRSTAATQLAHPCRFQDSFI
jgi:hypothetical protein